MTTVTQILLSPDELKAMIAEAVAPYADALRLAQLNAGHNKHAYRASEVAERIGYSAPVVREFITKGRKDRNGVLRQLPAKEITPGDYRVRPVDLDAWLNHF